MSGRLRKNGGNVVSYFCTSGGRVVHAVVGPVSADRMLQEARWAVEAARGLTGLRGTPTAAQIGQVEAAHLAELGADLKSYRQSVRAELPDAWMDYQRQRARLRRNPKRAAKYRKQGSMPHVPQIEARRRAARRLRGDRVHQILAAQPLAPIGKVYREIFEKLANERVNVDRRQVYQAARLLKQARESSRPVMLVLHRKTRRSGRYDVATQQLFAELSRLRRGEVAVRSTTIVALPLDELPALSNLAELPVYQIARKASPVVVLTRSDGKPFDTMAGVTDSRLLIPRMRSLLIEQRLLTSRELAEAGKFSRAAGIARSCLSLTRDDGVRSRIRNRLAGVYCDWGDSLTADGKTTAAKRQYRIVQRMNVDPEYRKRADEQLR